MAYLVIFALFTQDEDSMPDDVPASPFVAARIGGPPAVSEPVVLVRLMS